MRIYEIGTGYTSIPADKGAATEIVVENLSRALIKQGHKVTVLDVADEHRLPTDLPITEIPMPRGFASTDEALGMKHKLKRVIYSVRLAKVLQGILRDVPDGERVILHFHNQYNAYFFRKLVPRNLRARAVVAYTVHSYIWHDSWDKIERTVRKRYFQEVDAMQSADVVFVLNADAAATIEEKVGVDAAKMRLVANGVDTDAYRPLSRSEVEDLRSALGLSGSKCVIQVGSVCDRKNQLGCLKMLEPLMREDASLAYIYAGGVIEPEYKAAIDSFAETHGISDRVVYLGEVTPGNELNRRYNLAECSIFSTKAEAFGLVVIEAMAAGRPVFVSKGLNVDLDGVERYSNGADLREKVVNVLEDSARRAELGRRAREVVLAEYSWDKIASDYVGGIETALGDR